MRRANGGSGVAKVRGWFVSTGAPPAWRTVGAVITGVVLAGAAGLAIHGGSRPAAVVVAAVAGGLVTAAGEGAGVPDRLRVRFALGAAGAVVAFGAVAVAVSGRPWLAALAMAAVAVFTSVGAGASPIGGAFGVLATLGYVLTVVIVSAFPLPGSLGSGALTATGAVLGAGVGLVVTAVAGALRRRRSTAASEQVSVFVAPWGAMWRSVRTVDEHLHDGLRRAIPLSLLVGVYEATGSHDVLWALVAALVVLMPTGKSPFELAAARVVSTVVGVVVLILLSALLPVWVLVGGAVPMVLLGTAYKASFPMLAAAATTIGAIVMVGAPAGSITGYAALRLVDTLAGAGIALAFAYLLWPADRPDADTPTSGGAALGAAP